MGKEITIESWFSANTIRQLAKMIADGQAEVPVTFTIDSDDVDSDTVIVLHE